ALRLSPPDEVYLFPLAGLPFTPANEPPRPAETIPTSLRRAVDGFTAGPCLVTGPNFDVLAFNAIADAIYAFGAVRGPFAHNHLWRLFMDPARRRLYVDNEVGEENLVGIFRFRYAEHLGDPAFEDLVRELEPNP